MNLSLTAPINQLSYGVVSLNILQALVQKGVNVTLFPIGPIQAPQHLHGLISQCIDNQSKFDYYAPSLRIFHQHDLSQHVGKGLKVGFPIFELSNFSTREKHHLGFQDIILTTSQWGKEVLHRSAQIHEDKICVTPLGVDESIYNPDVKPLYPKDKNKFIVLNIGKIEIRKGHDLCHEIFALAFPKEKDVELWMSWSNPFLNEEEVKSWEAMYRDRLGNRVKFIPYLSDEHQVASLIQNATVGFFPFRAEGWCLPLMNMMAMGKTTIVTNFSAPSTYITGMSNYLVNVERMEDAFDGKWFDGKVGKWASLRENECDRFANHLRKTYIKWKDEGERPNRTAIDVTSTYTWGRTANTIIRQLIN